MKKRVIILWIAFIACIVATVVLWFKMNEVELQYEEVEATVLSSKVEQVVNKKTKSRTNFYKVEVEYNGQNYELGNAHSASAYPKGKKVKAYLFNEKLYANVEGVKTATPVAKAYFVFLFGNFILLYIACVQTSKARKKETV